MKKLSFLLIAIFLFGFGCNKIKSQETESVGSDKGKSDYVMVVDEKLSNVNFSEMGNITNWDVSTGKYVDDWALTYEKPGSPAVRVDLILDDKSVCVVANEEYDCREVLTNEFNGKRLYVQGVRDGDVVTVKRITF
ncbi:MAG: hypothetical protein P1P90_03550 [Patescibacteria group bacterium]|nr:hypothetical protein [Patescibacteria group bacterium]